MQPLSLLIVFIFFLFTNLRHSANAYKCHDDEINFEHWCYKLLTNTSLSSQLDLCESSFDYFICLKEINHKTMKYQI